MADPLAAGDPDRVGPYRLEGRLGGGGMGRVYLARSRGGRPVTIKIVHAELAGDAGFRRRFAREVEAARRVGGFHTAQVVDADADADTPWLATAYIPGPSLQAAVADRGPMDPERTAALGAGLAEGLAAVHANGLVHRDLKPGNIILAEDGPRLIDFGIARALDAAGQASTRSVIGTPSYMAPEQARGHRVGPPADVFSLGGVLAFAATGRNPFGMGTSEAVLYRVVHEAPELSGIPEDLTGVITACMAKRPDDRPGVDEVLERLAGSAALAAGTAELRGPDSEETEVMEGRRTRVLSTREEEGTGAREPVRDFFAPSERRNPNGASERPAEGVLHVGNLGSEDVDVIVDGTRLDRIAVGDLATARLSPGTHSLRVRSGERQSPPQQIDVRPNDTTRVAFSFSEGKVGDARQATSIGFSDRPEPKGDLARLVALWDPDGRLTIDSWGLIVTPSITDTPVLWSNLDKVRVAGEGPTVQVVVWPKAGAPRPEGKPFQGGSGVIVFSVAGAGGRTSERIRAALSWFAGGIYVA